MVNHYELLYIIGAKMTEEEVLPVINAITNIIKGVGGEVKREENWGKRKLAYTIKRFQYGYYLLSVVDMEPEQAQKLNDQLRLNQDIIRYQIVKVKSIEGPKKPRPELEKSSKITYFGDDDLEETAEFAEKSSMPSSNSEVSSKPYSEEAFGASTAEKTEKPKSDSQTEEAAAAQSTENTEKPAEVSEETEESSPKKNKKAKVSIEELDKKIDEILNV